MNGDLYVGDMRDDFFDGHGVLTYEGERGEESFIMTIFSVLVPW